MNLSEDDRLATAYSILTLVVVGTALDCPADEPPKVAFERAEVFEEMNDLFRPIVVNPKYALAFLFAYFLRCFLLPWSK
jgi:hypothetical protein